MSDDSRKLRFEQVVMPHVDAAYGLARWLIRDRVDAEDVMQDAMLRAFKYLDSCREDSARPWVLRIVRNACYDWLQAKAAIPESAFADIDPEDGDGAAYVCDVFTEPAADPESLLLRQDLRIRVKEIIADLSPQLREVLILRELEELSYREIAAIVGIPIGTVMSRLSRARGQMLKEWNRHDG